MERIVSQNKNLTLNLKKKTIRVFNTFRGEFKNQQCTLKTIVSYNFKRSSVVDTLSYSYFMTSVWLFPRWNVSQTSVFLYAKTTIFKVLLNNFELTVNLGVPLTKQEMFDKITYPSFSSQVFPLKKDDISKMWNIYINLVDVYSTRAVNKMWMLKNSNFKHLFF